MPRSYAISLRVIPSQSVHLWAVHDGQIGGFWTDCVCTVQGSTPHRNDVAAHAHMADIPEDAELHMQAGSAHQHAHAKARPDPDDAQVCNLVVNCMATNDVIRISIVQPCLASIGSSTDTCHAAASAHHEAHRSHLATVSYKKMQTYGAYPPIQVMCHPSPIHSSVHCLLELSITCAGSCARGLPAFARTGQPRYRTHSQRSTQHAETPRPRAAGQQSARASQIPPRTSQCKMHSRQVRESHGNEVASTATCQHDV